MPFSLHFFNFSEFETCSMKVLELRKIKEILTPDFPANTKTHVSYITLIHIFVFQFDTCQPMTSLESCRPLIPSVFCAISVHFLTQSKFANFKRAFLEPEVASAAMYLSKYCSMIRSRSARPEIF